MTQRVVLLLPLLLIELAGGCAPRSVSFVVDETAVPAGSNIDWSDWGLVLNIGVEGDRVAYEKILARLQPLDRFLRLVGQVGPESSPDKFPTTNHLLAYYINCYNATIVRGVVECRRQKNVSLLAVAPRADQFQFLVDGQSCQPARLAEQALKLAGDDWRVRFALCDGTLGGPPLFCYPFLPDMLDAQLSEATRRALASPQVVAIDHGEFKRLVVWRGLFDIRNELVDDFERRSGARSATLLNVLLAWTPNDPVRRSFLNSAIGYKISIAGANQTLNAVQPVEAPQKR